MLHFLSTRMVNGAALKRIYLLLFALTLTLYVDRASLSISAIEVSREFDLSPVEMGYLLSSFNWLYFLALVPVGQLIGAFGPKRVGGLGIGLLSVVSALTGLATGFASLLMCRLAGGLCAAVTYPTGTRAIRDCVPKSQWGLAAAILHSGSLIGPALGAVGFAWLLGLFTWRAIFVVAGVTGLIWLAAWLVWYRERDQTESSSDAVGVETDADMAPPIGLRGIVRSPAMRAIALAHGSAGFATHFFLSWLPGYLQMEKDLPVMTTGVLTAAAYLGAAVLVLVAAGLSDRFLHAADLSRGRRRIWASGVLLCAATVVMVPLVSELWLIMLIVMFSVATCASAVSLNLALVNDLTRHPHDVGTAVGFISTVGNVFGLLSPIVTGYVVAETGSFALAFVIAGCLLAAGALVLAATYTRNRSTSAANSSAS